MNPTANGRTAAMYFMLATMRTAPMIHDRRAVQYQSMFVCLTMDEGMLLRRVRNAPGLRLMSRSDMSWLNLRLVSIGSGKDTRHSPVDSDTGVGGDEK